ncbi:diacylglycerol kinase family protein [Furfurilactobacillus sp. WILCCON 0119]
MIMASPDKRQTDKNHHFIQAFYHAIDGIMDTIHTEPNMRYHLIFALAALLCGLILQINRVDWLWITLAIFTVILAEFANTIAEALSDLVTQGQYNPAAKRVKDVAAGAVVVAAMFAIITGCLVFVPRVWQLLF